MFYNYSEINYRVMSDTKHQYETIPALKEAVRHSIESQQLVLEQSDVPYNAAPASGCTRYVVSGKRSFEAAKGYTGKKVAVLNFANNHSIGGAPFSAGAQEESLCRCSTLLACLSEMRDSFYERHISAYLSKKMNYMGNDDIIYTPDVVVFKTDERTNPIEPQMMPEKDWYAVNVITCAAPELRKCFESIPSDYESKLRQRIKRILDVAATNGNEVLILGAWGCGAFRNPSVIVARLFHEELAHYNFEVVEFALSSNNDVSQSVFAKEF